MKEDMYLRIKQVTARTGLSRATIYGMMLTGTFPMKTALGVRAVGWLASEIERWMLERKSAEKVGKEASPGRKRNRSSVIGTGRTTRSAHAEGQRKTQADVGPKSGVELDGWEESSTLVSDTEIDAIRSKLRAANRPKAVETVLVERSSKSLAIHERQPASPRQGKVTLKVVKRK